MAPRKNNGRSKKAKKALTKSQAKKLAAATVTATLEAVGEQVSHASESTTEAPAQELTGGSNVEAAVEATAVQTPKKKSKAKKVSKTVVHEDSEVQTELATVTDATVTESAVAQVGAGEKSKSGKPVRSFKVKLPGNENFEGRFTGLTPYQAANKALSKYYREVPKPKKQIQFTIRESTRGSKRNLYTYNGKREKLKVPVEYSIKDGRTIVKNYKNKLIKVKKAELASITV